jgi:hypothetical protein
MKKLLCIAMMSGGVFLLSLSATAQVKQGKTRLLKTKHLMSGLVKPNCAGIAEGLKTAPADDKAWEDLEVKAALLNEASYTLMDDGRCPDGDWANAAKALREGTAAVIAKIEAKDAAGAQEAFKGVTASCAACHKAHKK